MSVDHHKLLLGSYTIDSTNQLATNNLFGSAVYKLRNLCDKLSEIHYRTGDQRAYVIFAQHQMYVDTVSIEGNNDQLSVYGWIDVSGMTDRSLCNSNGRFSLMFKGRLLFGHLNIAHIDGWQLQPSKTVLTKSFTSIV